MTTESSDKQGNTRSLDGADSPEYWLGINPQLSITEKPFRAELAQYSLPEEEIAQHVNK